MRHPSRSSSLLLVFLAGLLPALCFADRQVILNVSVLSMHSSKPEPDQYLLIESGQITAFGPSSNYHARPDDRVIDGNGGFLMPGLIDAHVHLDHPQDLKMYPLYGVTSVINMRGLPWHLSRRKSLRQATEFAPDFVTAGDYLDGSPPDMLPMSSVQGTAAARATVDGMHRAGFDFIKIYSELTKEQYLAVCERARELGMKVLGHIPDAVTVADLLSCPQRNVAHGEQLFKLLENRQDSDEIDSLLRQMAAAGISLTANLDLYRAMGRQPSRLEQLLDRPESRLLHPASLQPWRPGINRYARRDAEWVSRIEQVAEDVGGIVRRAEIVASGLVLAGSDSPVAGAYPGESLIAEIEALHAAGMDAYRALLSATVIPGGLLQDLDSEYPRVGVIGVGARADLVLLIGNPVGDLGQLRSPAGVMLRGHWYWKSDLMEIGQRLQDSNAVIEKQVRALESAVFQGDMVEAMAMFEQFRGNARNKILFAQYPFFFVGFRWLYSDSGLNTDPKDNAKAVLLYDMYRQTYPEFHSSHHVYGLALEAGGQLREARKAQMRALDLLPDYQPALEAMKRLEQ